MLTNLGNRGVILKEIALITHQMDAGTRQKRIEALEAIKNNALKLAREGRDSLEVRDFVTEAKKELAYELPDEEAFAKAKNATLAYKRAKEGK